MDKQNAPYILKNAHWFDVKDIDYEVAVLPWGATEAHNYHLPYSTDTVETEAISEEACRIAWEKGAKVVSLPPIPYGVNTGQLDIKLDINLNPSTQQKMLDDILFALNKQGIHKFVLLNGHGGNNFKAMLRELQLKYDSMVITLINWFSMDEVKNYFSDPGDHAGNMETSLMFYIAPDMVLSLEKAGDGKTKGFSIDGLKEGWVWAQREWTKISKDTGVGNPHNASYEKGENFFSNVTEKISGFLDQFNNTPISELYEK